MTLITAFRFLSHLTHTCIYVYNLVRFYAVVFRFYLLIFECILLIEILVCLSLSIDHFTEHWPNIAVPIIESEDVTQPNRYLAIATSGGLNQQRTGVCFPEYMFSHSFFMEEFMNL